MQNLFGAADRRMHHARRRSTALPLKVAWSLNSTRSSAGDSPNYSRSVRDYILCILLQISPSEDSTQGNPTRIKHDHSTIFFCLPNHKCDWKCPSPIPKASGFNNQKWVGAPGEKSKQKSSSDVNHTMTALARLVHQSVQLWHECYGSNQLFSGWI